MMMMSTPKSHPWGMMTPATEWKFCLICFLLFVKTHTKFGIKIFEIDMVTEFNDFWPHPKVTSLTLGWKFYLHFVLLVIPVNWICHMTMFKKKLTPWEPPEPSKSHPLGMTQATKWNFRLICFVSFICENTHKVWYKNLWNWLCN